jgi:hypothetical protein
MAKEIGNFKKLERIGIEHEGESKLFGKLHCVIMFCITSKSLADETTSNQILEAMMDFSTKLPLLDLSLIPTANTRRLFHGKSCLRMGCGGGGDDDNGRRSQNRNTRTQPSVGLGSAFGYQFVMTL